MAKKKQQTQVSKPADAKDQLGLLTYDNFGLKDYQKIYQSMLQFRQNCAGENVEERYRSIEKKYLPVYYDTNVLGRYTLNVDGTATPDRLFIQDSTMEDVIQTEEPLIAIKIHTGLSLLTQRTPDVRWDSDHEDYEDNVPVLDALRKADWYDVETRQQYVMHWFNKLMFGMSYWRRYYVKETREVYLPSEMDLANDKVKYEKRTMTDRDQTCGEALSPLQVLMGPGTLPMKPSTFRQVVYEYVYTPQAFYNKFKDVVPEATLKSIRPDHIDGYPADMIRCRYLEDMDLDLYYVTVGDNEIELLKSHLPWNHKQLSVIMDIWLPRGNKNPHGLGPMEMMMEDKKMLDKFKSMTLTQVKFSIYKAIFYQGSLDLDGGENGDFRMRPDHAYKVSNPKDITFFEVPGPGADSWRAIDTLRQRIDDSSGITAPLGGTPAETTTAYVADMAKDAAMSRMATPLDNTVAMLIQDAYLIFELQKQYYSLPEVKELVDADELEAAITEMEQLKAQGKDVPFSIWYDQQEGSPDEETGETSDQEGAEPAEGGTPPMPSNMTFYKGTFRSQQLVMARDETGNPQPGIAKKNQVITPELFDWKGTFHVVKDSLLTVMPGIDRTRKLEFFNMMMPMFGQPPELVSKVARQFARLYGYDVKEIFPESWLQYLKQIDTQEDTGQAQATANPATPPTNPNAPPGSMQPGGAPGQPGSGPAVAPPVPGGGPQQGLTGVPAAGTPGQPLNFQQNAAAKVVSNVGGQKSGPAAASQAINKMNL